jgi:hypothetical protein
MPITWQRRRCVSRRQLLSKKSTRRLTFSEIPHPPPSGSICELPAALFAKLSCEIIPLKTNSPLKTKSMRIYDSLLDYLSPLFGNNYQVEFIWRKNCCVS